MKFNFSVPNDPLKWEVQGGDFITFATNEDAKKAEDLFNGMLAEIERLHTLRPEEQRMERARELLFEAKLQIAYLHGRGETTSTGVAMISKINGFLDEQEPQSSGS